MLLVPGGFGLLAGDTADFRAYSSAAAAKMDAMTVNQGHNARADFLFVRLQSRPRGETLNRDRRHAANPLRVCGMYAVSVKQTISGPEACPTRRVRYGKMPRTRVASATRETARM